MAKKEVPLNHLQSFIPEGSLEDVMHYLHTYKVHLTITRQRKTVLGDYRNKIFDKNHRITVNGNLNKFSFLITLLHEIGHLLTFEKYGHKVQPHGEQWKQEYGKLLAVFIQKNIFPQEIKHVLLKTLSNPAASSCADVPLIRVLRKFDPVEDSDDLSSQKVLIESLQPGTLFKIEDGRVFKKGLRVRTRFKCSEVSTGKLYLFSPVYEVWPAE